MQIGKAPNKNGSYENERNGKEVYRQKTDKAPYNIEETEFDVTETDGIGPGIQTGKDGICFSCESISGERPYLLLYRRGENTPAGEIPFPEKSFPGGIYSMKVRLPQREEFEYNYRFGEKVVTDPYAHRICGRDIFGQKPDEGLHGLRGAVVRKKYNWKEDRLPHLAYEDVIMYQLHVRGFTMQKNSGVRHKGTFRGVIEKLPYLKELGVNQLRLMPCYDFDEVAAQSPAGEAMGQRQEISSEKMNFWGYGSGYYFAPKSSYASVPERAPEELKELVRVCHQQGIEIIMEFWFGEHAEISMISQCLSYWAKEYHMDGFAVIARDSVVAELGRLPLFAERKLICTWYGQDTLEHRRNRRQRMLAESNDGFKNDCRRLMKGDEDCLNTFAGRLRRNPSDHAVINYITNHDGFTLMDLVSYDRKHNEANGEQGRDGTDYNFSWNCGQEGPVKKKSILQLRMQQMKNAFALMLLAQGTPMLLAGDEFGNSQQGNNNPYCHDSELTWTDWSRKRSYHELTVFVSELAAYRKKHRILHMEQELRCSDMRSCGYPDLSFHGTKAWYGAFEPSSRYLGCLYDEEYAEEKGFLYVVYNFHWEPHELALPQLPREMNWRQVMDTSKKESFIPREEQIIYEKEKSFEVPPRTVVILEAGERKDRISEESGEAADLGKDKRTL